MEFQKRPRGASHLREGPLQTGPMRAIWLDQRDHYGSAAETRGYHPLASTVEVFNQSTLGHGHRHCRHLAMALPMKVVHAVVPMLLVWGASQRLAVMGKKSPVDSSLHPGMVPPGLQ